MELWLRAFITSMHCIPIIKEKKMKKKIIIPFSIGIVALCVLVVVLLFLKHKVDYKTAEKNTSQISMEKTIGSKPDETKEENGMTINTYENSIYMDYNGKMDYYYLEDKLMMSRWETECDDRENLNEVYQAICKNISKDMGEGKADKDQQCTVWSSDKKDVTVGCNVSEDDKCLVYMVENQH